MAQKDAWRAYYELALGLTETSRKKAMKIVQDVAGRGGATAEQLQELVNAGMANRESMIRMIRVELDRALGRVGLATMDEVDELTKQVRALERQLHATRSGSAAVAPPASSAPEAAVINPAANKTAANKTAAKKTVAKKAVAKKTVAKTAGSKTAGSKTAGSKTAGSKTAGSKTAGPADAAVKKTAAKKATATAGVTP